MHQVIRSTVAALTVVAASLASPVHAIDTSRDVLHITPGRTKACMATDTDVYCWGRTWKPSLAQDVDPMPGTEWPARVVFPDDTLGLRILALGKSFATACALFSDHRLYCWGGGSRGQLGDGVPLVKSGALDELPDGTKVWHRSLQPKRIDNTGVLAGKTITALASSFSSTCVLADGLPYCWGSNDDGELGNGTTTSSSSPVPVYADGVLRGQSLVSLTAALDEFCALSVDGLAFCWGGVSAVNKGAGRPLGNGDAIGSNVPVSVSVPGRRITAIAPTECLVADGELYCWGLVQYRMTGANDRVLTYLPSNVTAVTGLSGRTVTAVAAQSTVGCAIASNRLICWGPSLPWQNDMIGHPWRPAQEVPLPTEMQGRTLQRLAFDGLDNVCLLAQGTAACWGQNDRGTLGNGSVTPSAVPVLVARQAIDRAPAERQAQWDQIVQRSLVVAEAAARSAQTASASAAAAVATATAASSLPPLTAKAKAALPAPSLTQWTAAVAAVNSALASLQATASATRRFADDAASAVDRVRKSDSLLALQAGIDAAVAARTAAEKEALGLGATLQRISVASETLRALAEQAQSLSARKTTITCVKGKLAKKVTAVLPKCPAGWRKKA